MVRRQRKKDQKKKMKKKVKNSSKSGDEKDKKKQCSLNKCKQQLIVHGALANENNNQLCIVQEIKNNDAYSCESCGKYVQKGT